MLSLRIGGRWAQELGFGKVGDLEMMHTYSSTGGGLNSLKWSMALPKNYWHPVLTEGTKVEVFRGPYKLGSAVMSEPDRTNWSFTADGLFKRAAAFKAVTAAGATTTDLQVAITQGNVAGLGWGSPSALPTGAQSAQAETQSEAVTIQALLDAYCTVHATRWGLDANDVPYIVSDPTTPTWALTPGIPLMPTADDNFVSRTFIRYTTAVTTGAPSAWASVVSPAGGVPTVPGGRDEIIDVSDLGVISQATAQAYADDYQAKNNSRGVTFTQGIDIAPGQLTNLGSQPIAPWNAGVMVLGQLGLHHGAINKQLGTAVGQTVTWVCGSTVYKATDNSLQIFGADFAGRTVAKVTAALAAAQSNKQTMGLAS